METISLNPSHQKSLSKLSRAIARSEGMFSLRFVECSYASLRQKLLQALQESCPEMEIVNLEPSSTSLYGATLAALREKAEKTPAAVSLVGLESNANLKDILAQFNQEREKFKKNCLFPVLVWMDEEILESMLRGAPDIYSWAIATEFQLGEPELIEFLENSAAIAYDQIAAGAKKLRLQPWQRSEIERARKALQDDGVDLPPELAADLEFIAGQFEVANADFESALRHYRKSLAFWQEQSRGDSRIAPTFKIHKTIRSAILQFAIARCYAEQENLAEARASLETNLDILVAANRLDLAANFIGELQEVLLQLEDWAALAEKARQGQQWHESAGDNLGWARDCGFLAEVALAQQNYREARQQAEAALASAAARNSKFKIQNSKFQRRNPDEYFAPTISVSPAEMRAIAGKDKAWYARLLAEALNGLGETSAAIEKLNKVREEIEPRWHPQGYVDILKILRQLYYAEGDYLKAFEIKQARRALQYQYRLRAFIGAGKLEPQYQSEATDFSSGEIAAVSGRQGDLKELIQNRLSEERHKLIILYGPSGVGKSSLIAAGLVPKLQKEPIQDRDALPVVVNVYSDWVAELGKRLQAASQRIKSHDPPKSPLERGTSIAGDSAGDSARDNPPKSPFERGTSIAPPLRRGAGGDPNQEQYDLAAIKEILRQNGERQCLTILIFDQFEEFFFACPEPEQRRQFYQFLQDCLDGKKIPYVKAILSLRQDYIYELFEFERWTELEFLKGDLLEKNRRYYLGNFSPAKAQEVIGELTAPVNLQLEPDLISALVGDLAGELQEVRPIEMQVAGAQLEEEKITALAAYRQLGQKPTEELIERWLTGTVEDCGQENSDAAWKVLASLTDEKERRPLRTRADLLAALELQERRQKGKGRFGLEQQLDLILKIAIGSGLVLRLPQEPQDRYQLVHDYFVQPIRQKYDFDLEAKLAAAETKAARFQKRTVRVSVAASIVLAALTGVAGIFAWQANVSKQEAILSKKKALAREWAATAESIGDKACCLETSSLLAVESMQESFALGISPLGADIALRKSLDSLPHLITSISHKGRVNDIVFSPDGKYMATASKDTTARLVEVPTGNEVAKIAHLGEVFAIAFSPDGKYLATGSSDKTARLVEVNTGKEIAQISHLGDVLDITFSADSKYLATHSSDKTARLIEIAGGRIVAKITHQADITDVAFSPNNKYLATGSKDAIARIVEIASGKQIARISHLGFVSQIAFSPNSKYLATRSSDNAARLVEVATGKKLAKISHQGDIRDIAFSPDSKYLATRSSDNTARLIKVATGKEVAKISHQWFVSDIAFSPNSKYLATGSWDTTVRLIEVASGKEIANFSREGVVHNIDFSPDGKHLAVGSWHNAVLVEVASGKEVAKIAHQGSVKEIAFSPDNKYLATGSYDKSARIVEIASGKQIARISHLGLVSGIALSPDSKYLATRSSDNTALLVELVAAEELTRISKQGIVWQMALSADGKYLATRNSDNTARLVEAATGKEIVRVSHQGIVWAIALSPDSKYLATSSGDGTARLVEVATGKEIAKIAHQGEVWDIEFSADSKYLATSSSDKTARLVEVASGEEMSNIHHENKVWDIEFSADSKYLATSSCDKTARLVEVATGKEIAKITHQGDVWYVAFSPNSKYLGTASSDNTARLVEVATGKEVASISNLGAILEIAFSADSRHLAIRSKDGTARLVEVATGHEVVKVSHQGSVTDVAFSPDGEYLATGSEDASARLVKINTGKEIARISNQSPVREIAFSPDGKYLATNNNDNTARLVEVATGEEVARIPHQDGVGAISFSADGKYLNTYTWDNMAKTSLISPQDLIEETCSRVSRNLSAEEWRNYTNQPLESYRRTCPNRPVHPNLLSEAADLAKDGKTQEAERIFRRVIELEPEIDLDPTTEKIESDPKAVVRKFQK